MNFPASVLQLFPIPIYAGVLESLTQDLKQFIKDQEFELMHSGKGYYTVNHEFLSIPELKIVKEEVDTHVETYVRKVLKVHESQKFYMTTSWALKHEPGNFAGSHSHTNSLISGVFYLNQNEKFGELTFEKTFDNVFTRTIDLSYTEFNTINSGKWSLQPSANMIVLFPSTLVHSVSENLADENRYSVAFNYFVKGEFGRKESKLYI